MDAHQQLAMNLVQQLGGGRPPTTDTTMMLLTEEIVRARAIRAAANEHNLKALSDFEYVQYAICTPDESIEKVVERMTMMQAFREEYKIQDTVEEGVQVINQLTLDQPGMFLSIEQLAASQNYAVVLDAAAFLPARIQTPEQYRTFLAAFYYCFQLKNCQFQAMRNGASSLVECMGTTTENLDPTFLERFQHELYRWYPKLRRETFLLNSPSVVNCAYGLFKRYMSPNHKKTLRLGYQILGYEGQRIDSLYKMPTAEAGRQNLLSSVNRFLHTRYHNQSEFRLLEGLRQG